MKKEDRVRRRDTFLADASDYAEARPLYPAELLEEAALLGGLSGGDSILEFGCGTGQATMWFAEQGYEILEERIGLLGRVGALIDEEFDGRVKRPY